MSDHAVRSHHKKKESGEHSIHSYQAVWMAHWSRTSKETSHTQKNLAVDHVQVEGNSAPRNEQQLPYLSEPDAGTNASNCSSEEFTEVPMARPANIPDDSVTVVSEFARKERLEHNQQFPRYGLSRNRDKSVLTIRDDWASSFYGQALGPQFTSKSGLNTSPRDLMEPEMSTRPPSGFRTQSQEHMLDQGGKSCDFVEKNSLLLPAPSREDFFASSPRCPVRPRAGKLEKINGPSSVLTAKGHFLSTSFTKLEPDQSNYPSSSAVLVHQLNNDPLMSKNQLAFFLGDNEHQKSLKNHHGSRFFHGQTGPFDFAVAECPSQLRNPLFDMETMRICTTIDSMEGSKFHRTMKELFLAEKKTDSNLLRGGGKIIRESMMSTTAQFKGITNTVAEFLGLSQNGGFKSHQQGVKLQPLWSSIDSEEKENAIDLKNESSAETDTMDMDTLKHPCDGDEVSLSNKYYEDFKKLLASQAVARCESEEGRGGEDADIPGLHQNYLALPSAVLISTNDKEPSMSKTQSLDAAFLLPDADGHMATSSKLRSSQSRPDPGSRWVKRLKVSTSESFLAHGTKTSNMEEATSSPKKFKPISGKTLKRTMTGLEPSIGYKSCEKKQVLFDRNEQLVMKDGGSSSTSESRGKSRNELLSNSWIRRWCRNHSHSEKKPEGGEEAAFVFCEPQSLKASLDEIQKNKFPSMAAMALMGKAMNGFRPCEFRKRGTFMVWNSK